MTDEGANSDNAIQLNCEKWSLLGWSKHPNIYWVNREWSRYSEVTEWLAERRIFVYQSILPHYDEFLLPSDSIRVELVLRFS